MSAIKLGFSVSLLQEHKYGRLIHHQYHPHVRGPLNWILYRFPGLYRYFFALFYSGPCLVLDPSVLCSSPLWRVLERFDELSKKMEEYQLILSLIKQITKNNIKDNNNNNNNNKRNFLSLFLH